MDGLITIGVLFVLALLAGTVLSFVNLGQISDLKRQLAALKALLIKQSQQIESLQIQANQDDSAKQVKPVPQSAELSARTQALGPNTAAVAPALSTTMPPLSAKTDNDLSKVAAPAQVSNVQGNTQTPLKVSRAFNLEKFLMGNGLLWLGAVILAIGGVFLAKYSIESGLFPPQLRILLGAAFGIALVAIAEYLYRNPKRYQINSPVISAALASGGVITCFAMVLVAFDFYAYLSPTLAFGLLAAIALASAWLSLRLGPILAGIGVIGAYAVPALVSTGSNNVLMLLMYVSAVSFSAVWIHQIVQKNWIWWLGLVGHFGWFLGAIILSTDVVEYELLSTSLKYENIAVLTVFALLSSYLFVLLPVLGWDLKNRVTEALSFKQMLVPRKEHLGIILPIAGMVLYALLWPFNVQFIYVLIAFSVLLMLAPLRHSAFDTWPFLAIIFTIFVYLLMPEAYDYSDNVFVFTGGYLLAQISALIALVYAFCMLKVFPQRPSFALLLVAAPLSLLSLSYALSDELASGLLYPLYAIELGAVALVFAILALKETRALQKVSFLLLANGALALIFTMLMSASTLTLALAVQITLMAVFSKKYALTIPAWLYKIAMIAVMLRLTAAPWLPEYANETLLGVHWTLLIFPLVFAVLWFARKQLLDHPIRPWFSGALLHLIALFVTTETSYFLTGEYPDFGFLSFQQSVLLAMNWLALGMLYLWRSQFASTPGLYKVYAAGLLIAVGYLHLDSSVVNNPFFSLQSTGSHPIINYLIALWLIPAIILLGGIKWNLIGKQFTKPVQIISGIMLFLYVNGVIRLTFNGLVSLNDAPILQAELYTYSIVWLVIAVGLIIFAKNGQHSNVNRLGFGILALVVLKAFLIDMANLEGLYRALSFIGLGLSLVGIGWLFQRFRPSLQQQEE
ncbi:DUF2339 domain-containing protein [Glaciecola sp. SC05]|uniref:DUF2339 domain-containing protein n=1 Tax=Glaciecola sp. SC05 TaxID=1987355 RepID=UPI003527713E